MADQAHQPDIDAALAALGAIKHDTMFGDRINTLASDAMEALTGDRDACCAQRLPEPEHEHLWVELHGESVVVCLICLMEEKLPNGKAQPFPGRDQILEARKLFDQAQPTPDRSRS